MKSRLTRRSALILAPAALAAAAAGSARLAHGQGSYPSRPIRLVVGFAAGGPTDVVARRVALRLEPILGQSIVVDNKPGASTTIATNDVVRAQPDGYTLYLTGSAALTITPLSIAGLTFDVSRDLLPVTLVGAERFAIGVHPSVPAQSLRELAALAKAAPGRLNYASSGTGNIGHLTGEMFNKIAGIGMTHVPYRGAAPAMQDVLAGHVQVLAAGLGTMYEQHKQGRLRVLAVTDRERSTIAPEIPTSAEAGYPDLIANSVFVLLVPARTPAPVVGTLDGAMRRVLASAEFRADLQAAAVEQVTEIGPDAAKRFVNGELKKWADLVQAHGIQMR
ncbi:MAG: tripartite tricarboxylate transporter substrate binding protein [Alphaproteobacteria bacterium]|nr:tripartite tricarboxylate transporter substrate binding protein [Alphaproteobacteria bacterium]